MQLGSVDVQFLFNSIINIYKPVVIQDYINIHTLTLTVISCIAVIKLIVNVETTQHAYTGNNSNQTERSLTQANSTTVEAMKV